MLQYKEIENVTLIGLGLLGGSLGLALDSVMPHVRRLGYSHRRETRHKAISLDIVDSVYETLEESVHQADLIILASPIGTFKEILKVIGPHLKPGAVVTDVGSTKVMPVRWAGQCLPDEVVFLGSHPMAGSEQQGAEYARADLFNDAHCIVTPTGKTPGWAEELLVEFWKKLGMRVSKMSPAFHDRVVGNISHLPHLLAMALIAISDPDETIFCGKGFLDTTRIASGPANVWRDIIMANGGNTAGAIDRLIEELQQVKKAIEDKDWEQIYNRLESARQKRDQLVKQKLQRKELPS